MSLKKKLEKLESYVQKKRLEKCVNEKSPEYIIEALKKNRDNSLKPGTYRAWHELIKALGEIGDQKAIDPIISEIYFLPSKDYYSKQGGKTIAAALKKIGGDSPYRLVKMYKKNVNVHQHQM